MQFEPRAPVSNSGETAERQRHSPMFILPSALKLASLVLIHKDRNSQSASSINVKITHKSFILGIHDESAYIQPMLRDVMLLCFGSIFNTVIFGQC
jgi:hypothetical protein